MMSDGDGSEGGGTSASTTSPTALQFQPFSSAVDVSFWTELARLKLDVLQLSSAAVPITGAFTTSTHTSLPSQLLLGAYAFDPTTSSFPAYHAASHGLLHNANTIDQFKAFDTTALLHSLGSTLWSDLLAAATLSSSSPSPSFALPLLSRFLLLTYADLKAHKYYYWFAFPALIHPNLSIDALQHPQPLLSVYTPLFASQLIRAVNAVAPVPSFFLVDAQPDRVTVLPLSHLPALTSSPSGPTLLLGFVDPSPLPYHPGWPLRNLLLYAAVCGLHSARVLCYRDLATADGGQPASLVLDVRLGWQGELRTVAPRCVGYERNLHGRLAPRMISLSSLMSPLHLAASSVNLNLRLMRWRALPALELGMLAGTRVLLLGAGTLGCNVGRLLLAWGVTKMTFVDSGMVSYSNPVRQSLFRHEDCVGGGRGKAECAAERLKEVYPGVEAVGVKLSIPMVGHWSEKEDEEMRRGVREVDRLIAAHDVVFQLTDSRESRWLPTVICAGRNKLCLNAALGFDTFVVMRHGDNFHPSEASPPATGRLGCYFCNDVVAPTDSSRDRTLDQQCTVTRPGLAYLASAYAVELLVNTLHHPLKQRAPAGKKGGEVGLEGVPHQLRGFLGSFEVVRVEGQAFDRCTGCGERVVQGYVKGGEDWLMAALKGGGDWLEEVSGLKEMKAEMERKMEEQDWTVDGGEDEDGEFGGDGEMEEVTEGD